MQTILSEYGHHLSATDFLDLLDIDAACYNTPVPEGRL